MRVITGTARGRVLKELEGLETRPTTGKVKESLFSIIQFDIEGRRVLDLFGGSGQVLVLNANNKLVQYVLEHTDGENTPKICEQLYDLAQLSHGSLTPERMTKFIARSNEIMGMMLN